MVVSSDLDPTLGHQLFYVPQAQCESEIQPDRMTDDLWREPVTLVGYRSQRSLRLDHRALDGERLALD